MIIIKGDVGKSRVIDILMNKTNSICFEYYDYPVIFEAICLDSKEYSLKDFLECISDEIKNSVINDRHYDYLLVYTNENEENLQEIIDWLNKYRCTIPCRDIVVTCKW